MLYSGAAEVRLTTQGGIIVENRHVIVDAPDPLPAGTPEGIHPVSGTLKVSFYGEEIPSLNEAVRIEVHLDKHIFAFTSPPRDITVFTDRTEVSL